MKTLIYLADIEEAHHPLCWNIDTNHTIDTNDTIDSIGLDRLADSKAVDLNHFRQPTLWLHDLSLEMLIVYDNELRLFWAKALMSRVWYISSWYNF